MKVARLTGGMSVACASSIALAGALAALACSARPEPPNDLSGALPAPPHDGARDPALSGADATIPDGGACRTLPPTNRCGLDPQCGCGPSQTCEVTNRAAGAVACVTSGAGTLGRSCTQTADCLAGLTCQFGACRPYCSTPGSKCSVGGTDLCVDVLDDASKPLPNSSVCTIACDPRNPAPVCGNNACLWLAAYYAPKKVSDCNAPGTKEALQPCALDSDCAPGHACADHPNKDVGLECERWCRIGEPADCPPKFVCNDVFGENAPVVDGFKEGLCQDG